MHSIWLVFLTFDYWNRSFSLYWEVWVLQCSELSRPNQVLLLLHSLVLTTSWLTDLAVCFVERLEHANVSYFCPSTAWKEPPTNALGRLVPLLQAAQHCKSWPHFHTDQCAKLTLLLNIFSKFLRLTKLTVQLWHILKGEMPFSSHPFLCWNA